MEKTISNLSLTPTTFTLPLPGVKLAKVPIVLKFGGGGGDFRGRVLGLGTRLANSSASEHQYFRMDYHSPHGKGKSDYDYFNSKGSQYDFHMHIPK